MSAHGLCAVPSRITACPWKSIRRRILGCRRTLVNHVSRNHGVRSTVGPNCDQRLEAAAVAAAHARQGHAVAVPHTRWVAGFRRLRWRRHETSVARASRSPCSELRCHQGAPGGCASSGPCPRPTLLGSHAAARLHRVDGRLHARPESPRRLLTTSLRCATTSPCRVRTRTVREGLPCRRFGPGVYRSIARATHPTICPFIAAVGWRSSSMRRSRGLEACDHVDGNQVYGLSP